eukprot:TRINITY_DN907_c0_g1_i1.p1 TRINITY_DN907_c0_g1~~TRINITY_DN907_c0_g1_i1.p1  ORF type:complete len:360 (+),score=114.84 TRINITY_DN907_c0_g1_i1:326-1405(+)
MEQQTTNEAPLAITTVAASDSASAAASSSTTTTTASSPSVEASAAADTSVVNNKKRRLEEDSKEAKVEDVSSIPSISTSSSLSTSLATPATTSSASLSASPSSSSSSSSSSSVSISSSPASSTTSSPSTLSTISLDKAKVLCAALSKEQLVDICATLASQHAQAYQLLQQHTATVDTIALRKLFIRDLPYTTSSATLRSVFEKYGEVLDCAVIYDTATKKSRGFGFITFKTVEAAESALKDPVKEIEGRKSIVKYAQDGSRPPKEKQKVQTQRPTTTPMPFVPFTQPAPQIQMPPQFDQQAMGYMPQSAEELQRMQMLQYQQMIMQQQQQQMGQQQQQPQQMPQMQQQLPQQWPQYPSQ